MNRLRVSILQMDIAWENKQDNLRRLREKLEALRGATEIIVLPETFSTGFSMNTDTLAEPVTGNTITTLRQWASEYQIAIAGSYIACEENFVSSESNPCLLYTSLIRFWAAISFTRAAATSISLLYSNARAIRLRKVLSV